MRPQQTAGTCQPCTCSLAASVIIPAFNASATIADQLAALSRQDTPHLFEVIVADNGSTDDTADVVAAWGDRLHRLVLVDAGDAKGAAHARNSGAAAARSPLLLFCDADDEADEFWVHQMVRAARPSALLAGRLDYTRLNAPKVALLGSLQRDGAPAFWGRRYAVSANTGLHRSDFQTLEGFSLAFTGAAGEDIDLPLRAQKLGMSVAFVPEAVMHYRLRPDAAGRQKQAAGYGAAAPLVFSEHDDLLIPSLADELAGAVEIAIDAARHRVAGRPFAIGSVMAYAWHNAMGNARRSEFWNLRRRYPGPPDARWFKASRARNLAGHVRGRLLPAPAHSPEQNAWAIVRDLQQRLVRPDLTLVGLGLLAGADLTLEVQRGDRTWHVNPAMDPIVTSLIGSGGYGVENIREVSRTLRHAGRTGTVVNVGANIGTTAVELAAEGWPVIAIEPVPAAARLLRRNLEANGVAHLVIVIEAAAAHEVGAVDMVVGDNLSTSEIVGSGDWRDYATPNDRAARVVPVRAAPLSALLREAGVDLADVAAVWSDTEGFERAVIEQGRELWREGVPLWAEVRPSALRDHGTLTDFCSLAAECFRSFRPRSASAAEQPIADFREFVDSVGLGRWDFTDVLLLP